MRVKSRIQTADMTQPGGVYQGFMRVGYQVETELLVKTDPSTPAHWQRIMLRIAFEASPLLNFSISSPIMFRLKPAQLIPTAQQRDI
jgi:hypothetical protein